MAIYSIQKVSGKYTQRLKRWENTEITSLRSNVTSWWHRIWQRIMKRMSPGSVINAFSEPFVIPKEMFEVIVGMDSSLDQEVPE